MFFKYIVERRFKGMKDKAGKMGTEKPRCETYHVMEEITTNMLGQLLKPPTFNGQVSWNMCQG